MLLFQKKIFFWSDIIILFFLLAYSIHRDIKYEETTLGDLRNRIVGARLQKDGLSPYFYKWKHGDSFRYLDPGVYDSLKVSGITASPFFNHLISPICDLPQYVVSRVWLCIEYLLLLIICICFVQLALRNFQKIIIINVSILFTYTEAWRMHIVEGQIYLLYAALLSLIIYGLANTKKKNYTVLAAIASASLIWMRPYALVIFIPLLFRFKFYSKYILITGLFALLYGLFVLVSDNEKKYWTSYRACLEEQVKSHQQLGPTKQTNEPAPVVAELESFDLSEMYKHPKGQVFAIHSEHGNIFVVYKLLLNKKMSLQLMSILFMITIATLMAYFIYYQSKNGFHPGPTILLAVSFYMIADLFSPIHRYQYYTVQWYPLVLFAILLIRKWNDFGPVLLLIGLCLNITNISAIPMRHTIGEYLWLLSLLLIAFTNPLNKAEWKLQ